MATTAEEMEKKIYDPTRKPAPKSSALRQMAGKAGKYAKVGGPLGLLATAASTDAGQSVLGSAAEGVREAQAHEGNTFSSIHAGVNKYMTSMRDKIFADEDEQGVEVQPSNIPQEQSQDVRTAQAGPVARSDFNEPDIDYNFDVPGQVTGSVRDSQGRTGTITGPEEALASERGTMTTYSASDVLNDPDMKRLANEAAAGRISTAEYNAGLRQIMQRNEAQTQGGGTATADRIAQLENELSSPGRGANQSISDMLAEASTRKNKRRQLEELYGVQKNEQTAQASRERTASQAQQQELNRQTQVAIANQKSIRESNTATRKEKEAARKESTRLYDKATEYYREEGERRFPDDPDAKNLFVARQQMTHIPGNTPEEKQARLDEFYKSEDGRLARRSAKQKLVELSGSERGMFDFFNSDAMGQEEIDNLDFSGWTSDKGAWPTDNWLFGRNDVFRKGDNYIYLDNLPDDLRYIVDQLIQADNPENKASVRQGQ